MKHVLSVLMLALASFSANAVDMRLSFFIPTLLYESGELPAIQAKIASTSAACAAAPYRGTVYYYCDCGPGAEADCAAGSDANDGLSPDFPRQTIANAIALENTFTGDTQHTITLCKGGSFQSLTVGEYIRRSGFTAGTTPDDLREYTPTVAHGGFDGTAKPILRLPTGNTNTVLRFQDSVNYGGIRIMNLAFKAEGTGKAIWFYDGPHDVTMCNLDIDNFSIGVYVDVVQAKNAPYNIALTGSTITNSLLLGYLGAGDNSSVTYNTFRNNGGVESFDHSVYISSDGSETNGFNLIGNYFEGQYGATCAGAVIVGHGQYDSLTIRNNYIYVRDGESGQGCWGIAINNNAGYFYPEYFRNMVISGNTVINAGNTGITASVSPGLIVENNRVYHNWASNGYNGIDLPWTAVAKAGEPLNDGNIVRNNVVYIGPAATGTISGVKIALEGTGHIVSNNTVYSAQTVGALRCYYYGLATSAYSFINNNHCYAPSITESWEHSYATLSAWQTYSGFDMNSVTGDPGFTSPATLDFHSTYLKGRGNSTYKSVNDFVGRPRPTPPAIGPYE